MTKQSSVVANFLKVTTNHFFSLHLIKGHQGPIVCLAWHRMCTSTEGQKTFAHGTTIQSELKAKDHCSTGLKNKFLFSELQHSKQCRKKQEVPWRWTYLTHAVAYASHVSQWTSPYSAFHVFNH